MAQDMDLEPTPPTSLENSTVSVEQAAAPAEPAPAEPAPTQSAPTQSAPTQSAPTQPAPTQPAPTQPAPTQPAPSELAAVTAPGQNAGLYNRCYLFTINYSPPSCKAAKSSGIEEADHSKS
ncbi:hypothetical protein V8C44DRAFT_360168 [Trichoderma aethiopicum]